MLEKIIKTDQISREKWLEYRRQGIGGSEAAIVVGLNRFGSPLQMWADKNGIGTEQEETEIMRQGTDFEAYVAQRWCEATGKKVHRRNYIFRNTDFPYSIADVDREVCGENAGLECKTTSLYNPLDFENGEIPPTWYVQCQHYMAVLGYDRMYLAVLVLSKAFYHFTIERDENEISALMQAEGNWWEKYIIGDEVPEPDGSEDDGNFLKEHFKAAENKEVFLDAHLADLEALERLDNEIKQLTKQRDQRKQAIMQAMGEASHGSADGWNCTWSAQTRKSIDGNALKEKYPEIYEKCLKTSESRVFRYKRAK